MGAITAGLGLRACWFVDYGLGFLLGLVAYCGCVMINSVGITRYILVVRNGC